MYIVYMYMRIKPAHWSTVGFTKEELDLYNRRYENGYDLKDDRYTLWLNMVHPSECVYHFGVHYMGS